MNNIKIKLSDSFFEPEIRSGCYVDLERKKIWAVELDLLNEFFRVCHEYDIEAYVVAGTLLGAIRHKGFIPWDDDVDVCMNRDNFERLCSVADKAFKYPYFFQTARNDQTFFSTTARLRNSDTTGIVAWEYSDKYNNGIFLDCFVMDAIPQNKILFKIQRKMVLWLKEILTNYKSPICGVKKDRNSIKRIIFCRKTIYRFISYEKLLDIYDKVSMCYNGKSDLLAFTNTGVFAHKYRCNVCDLSGNELVEFETIKVPVPQNAERILHEIYGDYKKFPSKEEIEKYHNGRIIFDADTPYKQYFEMHKNIRVIWDEKEGKQIIINQNLL